jgi:hypothetical protein
MREPCPAFEQHAHVVTCPSLLSWGSAALEPGAAHVVRPGARPIPLYRWFLPMGRVALASGGPCEYTVSSAFNSALSCVRIVVCRAAACAARAPPSAMTHAYSHTARVPGSRPRHRPSPILEMEGGVSGTCFVTIFTQATALAMEGSSYAGIYITLFNARILAPSRCISRSRS